MAPTKPVDGLLRQIIMPVDVGSDTVKLSLGASSVEVALKGATVISYVHDGRERLFVSSKSDIRTSDSTAIRGGVPLCWPVFGPPPAGNELYSKLKQHGFARTNVWEVADQQDSKDGVKVVFKLSPTEAIKSVFKLSFALIYTVDLRPYSLRLTLHVANPSNAVAALPFQTALHTYFRLPQGVTPPDVSVDGLENLAYNDKVSGEQKVTERRKEVVIDGPNGEIDRVYFRAPNELVMRFKGQTETVKVTKSGFADAVVWNPGPKKGSTIADMEEGGYDRYVCLEGCQVEPFVYLDPGKDWTGTYEVSFGQ
ncbi:hypothetical protein JCM10295v2_000591 [Rhodotorula toruloides]